MSFSILTIAVLFFRQRYDAKKTLETFRVRSRDEVDLEHLNKVLFEVVAETMQPVAVTFFLREDDDEPERQGSSGNLSQKSA